MHRADVLTATEAPEASPLDRNVARQAAQWLVLLHSGEATAADRIACAAWRAGDPEHERAWRRAQRLSDKLDLVPPEIGVPALGRPVRRARRRATVKALLALMTAAPAAYVANRVTPWREWAADHRTATGERREIGLADGTRVHLNTASAVDVAFDAGRRNILLRSGEILVETALDTRIPARPLAVLTEQGSIRALGTRFLVRHTEGNPERVRVAILHGAVEIRPAAANATATVIEAGWETHFTSRSAAAPERADRHAASWTQGVLYANAMRLGDFSAELGRHRPGLLRCDPLVADLLISGAFQLDNSDNILSALPDMLPVSVVRRTRYWVVIAPSTMRD